jgi:hypothetical protein
VHNQRPQLQLHHSQRLVPSSSQQRQQLPLQQLKVLRLLQQGVQCSQIVKQACRQVQRLVAAGRAGVLLLSQLQDLQLQQAMRCLAQHLPRHL